MFYAYFVRCADGTLYGGYTNDLQKRLAAHNSGKGARYTRSRRPVELVYWEPCPNKEAAQAREWQLKKLPRAKKLALIAGWSPPAKEELPAEGYRYYLMNKAYGPVTARRDDRHPTVMEGLAGLNNPRLSPVGRLDRETEGLLLITDDGRWNRMLTLPDCRKEKTYAFTLLGDLTEEKRLLLEGGVLLRGEQTPTLPARITVTGKSTLGETLPLLHPEVAQKTAHNPHDRPVTFGEITVTEGRNRQVRRMMKHVRCLVLRLKRVRMGEYTLPEDLLPGEWVEIFPDFANKD